MSCLPGQYRSMDYSGVGPCYWGCHPPDGNIVPDPRNNSNVLCAFCHYCMGGCNGNGGNNTFPRSNCTGSCYPGWKKVNNTFCVRG